MNFVYNCANRERDLISRETGLLTELEGSICTGEFIYPYSDIDIRVYSSTPKESAYKWRNKNGIKSDPICLESLHADCDGCIYVFSYSKKFCSEIRVKFEVSFAPLSVRYKFKDNEKNRIKNIDMDKWIRDKITWYKRIENETDDAVKKILCRDFMIWMKGEIAKYKLHNISYGSRIQSET